MDTVLFFGFAAAYLVLLVWSLWLVARRRTLIASDLVVLVIAGLVYDNTVIAIGRFVGEGALLEGLNLARFWAHAFLTPLLVIVAWHTLVRAGIGWARTAPALGAATATTAALMVFELITEVVDLQIAPGWEYGVLSYSSTEPASVPAMVVVVALVLLVASALVWWKQKWAWFFVAVAVMTLGTAIPIPVESGAATNAFELVLLIGVVATVQVQDHRSGRTDRSPIGRDPDARDNAP